MRKESRTKLLVKGLNQERAINDIIKKVKIYNFKRIEHNLSEFEVDYHNKKQVKTLLEQSGLEIVKISHRGPLNFLKQVLTSYGLIAALIICLLTYIIQYNFVVKIDIYGVSVVEKQVLDKFVKENLSSRFKHNINTKSLEVKIKDNFEDVSSVSVAIIGQSLVININEADNPDEMKEGRQIVSKFDGIITKINLIQGTLAVKEGDIVRKGDVLVYPYIIDSEGNERSVFARAEIFADIWLSGSQICFDNYIERLPTGKKFTVNEVYISSLLLYSSGGNVVFADYETEETWVDVTHNNLLPIKRRHIVYYEMTSKEISCDFSQIKEEQIEKARQKALIFLSENEIIKEENYHIRESGSVHEIEFVITVNRNIGG